MSYYYPPGTVLPGSAVLPGNPPPEQMEKPMYRGAAPGLPSHLAYPQPNSIPQPVPGHGIMRHPTPVAVSMPTYVSTGSPYYSSGLYASQAAPGGLYASASLAYAAQPHLGGQPPNPPGGQIQPNPYMGAAVPSRFPAPAYSGAHIITTTAGPMLYGGSPMYRPATASNHTPYHPSIYAQSPSPLQAPLSYPGMPPSGPPLMGAAPGEYSATIPPYTHRM